MSRVFINSMRKVIYILYITLFTLLLGSCGAEQAVKKGDTVIVLEAMKMENNIDADRDGKIAEIRVAKGDTVMEGAVLVTIE